MEASSTTTKWDRENRRLVRPSDSANISGDSPICEHDRRCQVCDGIRRSGTCILARADRTDNRVGFTR